MIAGNVATPEAVMTKILVRINESQCWSGRLITKLKTGFGTGGWQLAALRLCGKAAKNQLLLMVVFVIMVILQNQCALVPRWL